MRDAPVGRLRISIEQLDAATVVRAEGEVDLGNADRLAGGLRTAESGRDGRVVLDLLGVPFMDSSGLKVLLVAAAELGERLSLVMSPGAPVGRLLELAEVRDRFAIHETLDEAILARPGGSR